VSFESTHLNSEMAATLLSLARLLYLVWPVVGDRFAHAIPTE
jgi:hypothetical protein